MKYGSEVLGLSVIFKLKCFRTIGKLKILRQNMCHHREYKDLISHLVYETHPMKKAFSYQDQDI